MAGVKIGSRKLLVILAFLMMNTHSITYTQIPTVPIPNAENAASNQQGTSTIDGEMVMLMDRRSSQCLGAHGDFGECGELSLWLHTSDGKKEKFHSITTFRDAEGSVPAVSGECLGRKRSITGGGELKLVPCGGISSSWSYDESSGKLMDAGLSSKLFGTACVSNGNSILQSCRNGYTALKKVLFHATASIASPLVELPGSATPADASTFTDTGTWRCPVTGQVFPRNLDQHLGRPQSVPGPRSGGGGAAMAVPRGGSSSGRSDGGASAISGDGRQVFMGAGVFSKAFMGMTFNVYSMAWYVEAAAAQTDPSLLAYRDKPLSELQASEDFYELLSSAGRFDRTLFVKLAMTLKTQMLLEGFLSEIVLQPQNKAAVARASAAYTAPVCPEGLEIIFTWRVPKQQSSGAHSASEPATGREYLEVRIGDMYFELHEPGLAADFMRQFFARENPVSPTAKRAFVTFFPALLRGDKPRAQPPAPAGITGTVPSREDGVRTHSERRATTGLFGLRSWRATA